MTPNDDTHDQELLDRYRRASDADGAGPSDTVRMAILGESRRVAAELAKQAPQQPFDASRPAANDSHWKIPAFGTVGAALLAALLFAPHYWESTPPARVSLAPAPASVAAQVQSKSEAPKLGEVQPYAAQGYAAPSNAVPSNAVPSNAAPARQSLSDSTSSQDVVAAGARQKSSKSYGAPSAIAAAPAPTAPPSVAQNYAPVSPSTSRLSAAPLEPAARPRSPDPSARAAESNSLSMSADRLVGGAILKPATLQSAVAQGDLAQAATLLDQGAVIDARDEAGRTPLMLAVTQDRLEIVRLLLARGADPNAADNTGHTPLQQATKRNLQDVAALLERAGAH